MTFNLKRDRDAHKRERIRRQQLGGAAAGVMLERDMLLAVPDGRDEHRVGLRRELAARA